MVGAFRQLSYKVRRALKQRNLTLQSRNRKVLLPVYQMTQLKRALRPMRSRYSSRDRALKRPLDYFLLDELGNTRVCPTEAPTEDITAFAPAFMEAEDTARMQILATYFPDLVQPTAPLSAELMGRLYLLCAATSQATSATALGSTEESNSDMTLERFIARVRRLLIGRLRRAPLASITRRKRKLRRLVVNAADFRHLSLDARRKLRVKIAGKLHPERRLRVRQLRRLARKSRRVRRYKGYALAARALDTDAMVYRFQPRRRYLASLKKKVTRSHATSGSPS